MARIKNIELPKEKRIEIKKTMYRSEKRSRKEKIYGNQNF